MSIKSVLAAVSSLALLFGSTAAPIEERQAEEYTDEISFTTAERNAADRVADGNFYTYQTIYETAEVTAEHPFTQMYIVWRDLPGEYSISYDGGELACGENGFLHELVTFPEPVNNVVIHNDDAWLSDIRLFSDGELPDDVQVWQPADGKADVLVFPTHADDDCLFFGAFIADAVDRGLDV